MQHPVHHNAQATALSEWVPLLLVVTVAILYLYTVLKIGSEKGGWNHWRTVSFLIGITMLCIALVPTLMRWAHQDLRGHMVQHLLIGMYAPLFLVLGAPITLALKALPVRVSRIITAILRSNWFYFLSHPVTAFLLNIGGMYLLYLTPLYVESLTKPYLHYIVHVHFLVAGYLFTWSMIGQEPVPKRPAFHVRVFMLFISIAAHAFLSKFMYAFLYPLHSPHSNGQIQEAAKLMYYWGDLSELLLAIVLFGMWYKKRGISTNPSPSTY
ncbi:cytochrome c oxidase assembly protein [Pontibacter kalidii]|uniref:cytochrome c oxidase assembly protein n=1 Tax=Pontibacter kalidii TaxID=2592049 RepID=UPI00224D6756|nr:cytochrome c oxidase assembly protein [Pontibacter kalidii]